VPQIAEAAPPELRGKLVCINNVFVTGGQFVACVVDALFAKVSLTQTTATSVGFLAAIHRGVMRVDHACSQTVHVAPACGDSSQNLGPLTLIYDGMHAAVWPGGLSARLALDARPRCGSRCDHVHRLPLSAGESGACAQSSALQRSAGRSMDEH
jgi:hypothetical protein